jgi:5-bromo-4-chloroindolyl phosphate hydrolysis protein
LVIKSEYAPRKSPKTLMKFNFFSNSDVKNIIKDISKYKKLSRKPVEDQRNTEGIKEIRISENLKKRVSLFLVIAIFTRTNVAKVE